jgi:hypothetical protein
MKENEPLRVLKCYYVSGCYLRWTFFEAKSSDDDQQICIYLIHLKLHPSPEESCRKQSGDFCNSWWNWRRTRKSGLLYKAAECPLYSLDSSTLKMKTLRSFSTWGTTHPKTQRHIPEDLNPHAGLLSRIKTSQYRTLLQRLYCLLTLISLQFTSHLTFRILLCV